MGKKILIASLVGNLIFVVFFTAFIIKKGGVGYIEKKLLSNNVEESKLDIKYNEIIKRDIQRVSLFDLLPISGEDIIFIGNSITNDCEWAEIFNNNK